MRATTSTSDLAVIDLGSNTAILTIFEKSAPLRVVYESFRTPRLQEGLVEGEATIAKQPLQRAVDALNDFRELCAERNAEIVCCGGTAPFRALSSADQVIDAIASQTSIKVEVIGQQDEAYLAYQSALDPTTIASTPSTIVVDIGGGSIELGRGVGRRLDDWCSLPFGCVSLYEVYRSFFDQLKYAEAEHAIRLCMTEQLQRLAAWGDQAGAQLRILAGTAISLGLLERGINEYRPSAVDGLMVSFERLQYWTRMISEMPVAERIATHGIPPGRADILVAGFLFLEQLCSHFQMNSLQIRNAGLRYGLALRVLGIID